MTTGSCRLNHGKLGCVYAVTLTVVVILIENPGPCREPMIMLTRSHSAVIPRGHFRLRLCHKLVFKGDLSPLIWYE